MDRCPHCDGELTWPKPRCLWCDREAVAYCDAAFGQTMVEVPAGKGRPLQTRRVWKIDSPMFTCDAPMCAEHRKVVGFLCGKDTDTFDRCPIHAGDDSPIIDITKEQADDMRRDVFARARRSRMVMV